MPIIGTAGHVDHGKSSLVAALTGTDPDRWAEEQLRGMTLDLGFARLVLDDGVEAGIVDVPGHERFLHNMLAGASGMEVLLLCVDAIEGVRAQTREHLDILRYLSVRSVVVALTKADLLDDASLSSAREAVERDLLGTIADGAAIVAVSSRTGSGLDALRSALSAALLALPPRDLRAPVYLPVDRSFALDGVGTVVTGTLMQGTICAGDEVVVHPHARRARARSVQVFGRPVERAEAGTRVAINLAGVPRSDVVRGDTIGGDEFRPERSFAVRFTPLPQAIPMLRRRTPVRAYLGAAEILGTLVFENVPNDAAEIPAMLHLREPTIAFPGVRFVLRRPSPKTLLGGGFVQGVESRAGTEGTTALEESALAALRERGLEPLLPADVAARVNAREADASTALEALVERGEAVAVARPHAFVDAVAANELLARIVERLEAAQSEEPWAMGLTSLALARLLDVPETLLVRFLAAYAEDGRLGHRAGYFGTTDFRPILSEEQRALFDAAVPVDPGEPLLPVSFGTVLAAIRSSDVAGAAKAFDTMLASGALVKVADSVYRGAQIAQIRARLDVHLGGGATMTAAEFRDLIGTSRKYAVPLLEWLDARGVTVRSGDRRSLRKRPA